VIPGSVLWDTVGFQCMFRLSHLINLMTCYIGKRQERKKLQTEKLKGRRISGPTRGFSSVAQKQVNHTLRRFAKKRG
jgi:hypothetical protein